MLCMPGMGDLRQSYRFLAPRLSAAGFRVATMDLRGLGESSARWDDCGQRAMGDDALALVRHLGGPAVVVGHSFTPDSATYAAVEAPEDVRGVVLLGPWASRPAQGWAMKLATRWVVGTPLLWSWWMRSLYRGAKPADLPAYLRALRGNLREPGRREAALAVAAPESVDALAWRARLTQPARIVMGARDPDFADPAAEAEAMRRALARSPADVVMVDDAGHYPHAQQPEATAAAVLDFLRQVGHVSD